MSKTDKTISEQLSELQQLVAWFESDEFTVEESIEKYAQAEALAATIETRLKSAKNDITVLKKKFDQA